MAVGRHPSGVLCPDDVAIIAPRRDHRPNAGRAVAFGLDDVNDHPTPLPPCPPVFIHVGSFPVLLGENAVGVVARRRKREIAEVDPDYAFACVLSMNAVGFMAGDITPRTC